MRNLVYYKLLNSNIEHLWIFLKVIPPILIAKEWKRRQVIIGKPFTLWDIKLALETTGIVEDLARDRQNWKKSAISLENYDRSSKRADDRLIFKFNWSACLIENDIISAGANLKNRVLNQGGYCFKGYYLNRSMLTLFIKRTLDLYGNTMLPEDFNSYWLNYLTDDDDDAAKEFNAPLILPLLLSLIALDIILENKNKLPSI